MSDSARDQLVASVKSLLASGTYSDLVITCGADTYNVHRAIVCPRSSFLAGAMRFGGKEASEHKIDLLEDEPEVIKRFIQFLYENDYEPMLPSEFDQSEKARSRIVQNIDGAEYTYEFPHTCKTGCPSPEHYICPHHSCYENTCGEKCKGFICEECRLPILVTGEADQLLTHAKMYQIADKYDVEGLKDLACEKFARASSRYYEGDSFVRATEHACNTTVDDDTGLRKIISQTVAEHISLLNNPTLREIFSRSHGLAMGVLEARAQDLGWKKE